MALLFCDSMDHYLTADILKKWTGLTNGNNYYSIQQGSAAPSCPGGSGPLLNMGNPANDGNQYSLYKQFTAAQTLTAGFWMYYASVNSNRICSFADAGTTQVDLRIDSGGHLVVTRAGTTLGTSTLTINSATWYFIEFKAKIDPSTGTYEARVNGVSYVSGTGANTRASANSTANQFHNLLLNNGNVQPSWYQKGLYLVDSSGSVANSFLGMIRVQCLRPSKIGHYSDWTPNFGDNLGAIEEDIFDGDLSFDMSASAGQIDTFEMQDLLATTATVYGIQHVMGARQDAGAARTIAALQRSSGTDYAGTTQSLAATYAFLLDPQSVNPATSAAFTPSDIAAMEAGFKLVS